jgi:hypothetical protein
MDSQHRAFPSVAEQLLKRAPAPVPLPAARPAAPSELQAIFARLAQSAAQRRY